MGITRVQTKRWTVQEFRRLFEHGFFRGARVELIEGEIVEKPRPKPPHTLAVANSNEVFVLSFRDTHKVFCQLHVEVSEISEPFPDLALIARARFMEGGYMQEADLVMEVSDTTLSFDRGKKGNMYAKWGLKEYWILNVSKRCLEVRRDPMPMEGTHFGYGWGSVQIVPENGSISPLCRPDVVLRVADLL